MSIDIERELRLAMDDYTRDVLAPPDLLDRVRGHRRRMPSPLAFGVAAMAAAATIVAVALLAQRVGDGAGSDVRPLSTYHVSTTTAQQERAAVQQMNDAVANWGPTRGDQADNSALVQRVRSEWAHPGGHPPELAAFEPVVSPDGPVRVLWVGTTPEGVAALAVQHTKDPVADWWFGVFTPDAHGSPRLTYRNQLIAGFDLAEYDPYELSFTTTSERTAVVIPLGASDTVRVALTMSRASDGRLAPRWQDASVHDGAAVVSLPTAAQAWGAVVEISHAGQVVVDHRLDIVTTTKQNQSSPQPSNVLGLWCNGCVVGGAPGPGYSLAMLQAWAVRHGPAYLPISTSEWSIGARLRDGAPVLVMQMWFIGQQARTVVLADHEGSRTVDVIADDVTDASARPLVAVRLPERSGWVVGAGPNATVTGWRISDADSWHDVASTRAVLVPTDAATIELRLVAGGHQKIVTEGS